MNIIILAAGGSTRLGKPKQLLPWRGTTLLQHAVQVASGVVARPIVVLGAFKQDLEGAQVVYNADWQEGIASSIRLGLQTAMQQGAKQALFMVCDQPFVSVHLLEELLTAQQKTGKPIVACAYSGTVGIPALFDSQYFPQLLDLKGDMGAKKIIHQYSEHTWPVPFPMGGIDVDTAEEYEALP